MYAIHTKNKLLTFLFIKAKILKYYFYVYFSRNTIFIARENIT